MICEKCGREANKKEQTISDGEITEFFSEETFSKEGKNVCKECFEAV